MVARDKQGHFLPRSDSLGKTYGVRVRKDLEPMVEQRASAAGITPTQWFRLVAERELAEPREAYTSESDKPE